MDTFEEIVANVFKNKTPTPLETDVVGSALILTVYMLITLLIPRKWRYHFWVVNMAGSGLTSIPKALKSEDPAERVYHAGWVALGVIFGWRWFKKVT